jgi:hypothetical protein
MPVHTCPRCKRANPELAVYCYFDGYELRAPTDGATFRMPSEFVFPTGRRCHTYDEFAQGCQEEWSAARDLLQRGTFSQFFTTCGRADLVRAAQDANATGNPDAALATFLAALPGVRTQTPRLDINPRRILLGSLLAGETRKLPITVTNAGQGTLQGTASITEGQDLVSLAEGRAVHELGVDAPRQQALTLFLNTRGLPANQGHGAKLTVVTNGGVAEVPLRLDLVARPFPTAPFQGVKAQRELAEKMRARPKAAVPLLESGEIRRWFDANGWTYPVAGPEVRGVAAVQQFFEAMGLSKPPVVQVTPAEVRLRCQYPESARFQLTLSTAAKKWVYATLTSDSPWITLPQPQVSGPQTGAFLIEVDSSRMTSVGTHGEGKLKVVANGGKAIEVRVVADVTGMPAGRAAPVPAPVVPVSTSKAGVADGRPAPRPIVPARPVATTAAALGRSNFLASLLILPMLFFAARLVMVPISDMYLRSAALHAATQRLGVTIKADSDVAQLAGWLRIDWVALMAGDTPVPDKLFDPQSPKTESAAELRDFFVGSFVRTLTIGTFWIGGLLGAVMLLRRGGVLDVPWGFVAGCVAGLVGAATFGSAFLVIEIVPEFLWHLVTSDAGGPAAWIGWVFLALTCWLGLGVGLGIVCSILPPLRRIVLLPLQRLPAALFQMVGMAKFAGFWWSPTTS